MKKVLSIVSILTRLLVRVLYMWYWWIPLNLGLVALITYFGLIYLLFGTIEIQEINAILGKNGCSFFWKFWTPFFIPIFLSLGSSLYDSDGVKKTSLVKAIRYRNGQMKVKSDKGAFNISKKTNVLDILQNTETDVFEKARKGFDARNRNKPPNEIFNDLMGDDKYN